MTHVGLFLEIDFERKVIGGIATITFDRAGEETTLDTRDLEISYITYGQTPAQEIAFTKSEPHPVRGTTLRFVVPESGRVDVYYKTSPTASGLQWLEASQTLGKKHPCLYTQGQALHAMSYLPCQNTPDVRFTFKAALFVPIALRGLMGGTYLDSRKFGSRVIEIWEMTQPIPAYLISFAVGDFVARDISARCRVYAEQGIIDAAAAEFVDIERMIQVVEENFGEYVWDNRFDMLIMPPSFPYGGMENPRLAFFSPTSLVGDPASNSVLPHELAHSWTGNLIGNAGWKDFWLNEGWTTYLEWRIIEALHGEERMFLAMHIGMQELDRSFKLLIERGLEEYTALSCPIPAEISPDDLVTQVPYVKGALFIGLLEYAVGRPTFDAFIRRYIKRFSFKALSTEQFLEFVEDELPGVLSMVNTQAWVYGKGLPENAPTIVSTLAQEVEEVVERPFPITDISAIALAVTFEHWTHGQMHLYLERVAAKKCLTKEQIFLLDLSFDLSKSANMDIRASYLRLALEAECRDADLDQAVANLMLTVGRLKYLRPIYKALAQTQDGYALATDLFLLARPNYHPIAVEQITALLEQMASSF